MRQLLPHPLDPIDPDRAQRAAARPAPADRPWVLLNMVASIDGATAVDGRSGALGGPTDQAVFGSLRAVADVILVAAGTVRAEGYGPPRPSAARRAQREQHGQAAVPRLAVVSRSLDLDPSAALFARRDDGRDRPLVLTGADAPTHRRAALEEVADVRTVGPAGVDLPEALALLGQLGASTVLCEGGPTLNGQLLDADLVDEVDLTVSPLLAGGDALRLIAGAAPTVARHRLAHLWHDEDDDLLFARYVRR